MTDEQRDQTAKMCDSINREVDKNKLEAAFEAVKRQLNAFIELRSIDPKNLPACQVRKVEMDCDCMTIITDTGHYVHVSAESGYEGAVDFGTGYPDIEDAYNMGILSQEQYDKYKKAQQDCLERRRKIDAKALIARLVREAGATAVQGYLDKLNP